MNKYRPYLLARINTRLAPDAARLGSILDYDYMGSSEFEWGAIPASFARLRLAIIENYSAFEQGGILEVREAPKEFDLVAKCGFYVGRNLCVLGNTATFERLGNSLWEGLVKLANGECRCKEFTKLDDHFHESSFSNMFQFDAWHDIQADLFIGFSQPMLMVVRALLGRPLSLETMESLSEHFRIGDPIEIVEPCKGRNYGRRERSVENWRVKSGTVAGITDEFVTVKSHGDRFRAPWALVLTRPETFGIPEANEQLRTASTRG